MALTVTTGAPNRRLARVESLKTELAITTSFDDNMLTDFIDRASAAIVSYCHRVFAREVVTETLPGFGDVHLQLKRTPIVAVSAVTRDGNAITDYSVADKARGWLYREDGWGWTAQVYPGLSGGGSFLDLGAPLPRQEEPQYSVGYTAGYLLPPQNRIGGTISADATDDSFNDSASLIPSLLRAGDVVETRGFATEANNGFWTVTGTPTAAKVQVVGSLTTEAAGASKLLLVSDLPTDIERACLEESKAYYLERKDDPNVVEKQVGVMRLRYSEQGGVFVGGLRSMTAVGLLRPWVRAA